MIVRYLVLMYCHQTSTIKVCCFPKLYQNFKVKIVEGEVVRITGRCVKNEDYDEFTIFTDDMDEVKVYKSPIIVSVKNIVDYIDKYGFIAIYKADVKSGGFPLMIYDRSTMEFRETTITVSRDILYNTIGIEAEASE